MYKKSVNIEPPKQLSLALEDNSSMNDTSTPTNNPNNSIIYEDDFDLYNILKDMVHVNRTSDILRKTERKSTEKPKDQTKSLTARLLDSHFTNGKNEWCLIENGMDLYRVKVKCIGTNVDDFGYGDPVYLDLQPLSTRIKLMCKLIIIIQGACLERSGPPKLVQDRCVQFDGIEDNKSQLERHDSVLINNNLPKIKSNSCENLLDDSAFTNSTDIINTKVTKKETEEQQTKISIFGTSQSKIKKHRLSLKLAKKKSAQSNALSDDESNNIEHGLNGSKTTRFDDLEDKVVLTNSCDFEHYFTHRISRNSFKDYASAPYYQYSNVKEMQFIEKSTNTNDSYLSNRSSESSIFEKQNDNNNNNNDCNNLNTNKKDQSTSTDGLLNGFQMGYFSKNQLLSSHSLYEKKTTLMNSYASISCIDPTENETNLLSTFTTLPIYIRIKNKFETRSQVPVSRSEISTNDNTKRKATLAATDSIDDEEEDNNANNKNGYNFSEKYNYTYKKVTKSKSDDTGNNKSIDANTSKSRLISNSAEEEDKIHTLKQGPKKSKDWTLFKNQKTTTTSTTETVKSPITIKKSSTSSIITQTTSTTTTKKVIKTSDSVNNNELLDKIEK